MPPADHLLELLVIPRACVHCVQSED